MLVALSLDLPDFEKEMVLIVSTRRFDREEDVVALLPGLEDPGGW
jgi:hypothetical protein